MTGVRGVSRRGRGRGSDGVSKAKFGVVEVGRKLGRMKESDGGALNGDERGGVSGVKKEVPGKREVVASYSTGNGGIERIDSKRVSGVVSKEDVVSNLRSSTNNHFVRGPTEHGGEGVELGVEAHGVMLGTENGGPSNVLGDGALRGGEGGARGDGSDGGGMIRDAGVREVPGGGDHSSSKGVRG